MRTPALLAALLFLGTAVAAPLHAPATVAAPLTGAWHDAAAARVAACGASASCKASAASAFARDAAATLGALPTGQRGVGAVTRQALELGGFPAATGVVTRSPTLEAAIARFYAIEGHALDADASAKLARVAPAWRAPLTQLVDAAADSALDARAILSSDDLSLLTSDLALTMKLQSLHDTSPAAAAAWAPREAALARVDRSAIAAASERLAGAISAAQLPRATTAAALDCAPVLDLVLVLVNGPCDDIVPASTLALIVIDQGGNDQYLNTAGAGPAGAGAALSWDMGAGDDTYRSSSFTQGEGTGGVGILLDEGGSDLYNATSFAQGFSLAGLGMVYDQGTGDDVYESPLDPTSIGTKAASLAGLGVLVDEGGQDRYQQDGLDGFIYGGGGTGLLLDRGVGDDLYLSRDYDVVLLGSDLGNFTGPIQISAEAGGNAILLDEGGNDQYVCGAHVRQGCQGAAGTDALALLLDEGGDDSYTMGTEIIGPLQSDVPVLGDVAQISEGQGGTYGLLTPPGPAIALLWDRAGSDHYVADKWAQGFGTGGLGALLDEGGSADSYSIAHVIAGARADGSTWADGAAGVGQDS